MTEEQQDGILALVDKAKEHAATAEFAASDHREEAGVTTDVSD